jgi:hypothetical protein
MQVSAQTPSDQRQMAETFHQSSAARMAFVRDTGIFIADTVK